MHPASESRSRLRGPLEPDRATGIERKVTVKPMRVGIIREVENGLKKEKNHSPGGCPAC
jgi:hypothetical protein